MTNKINNTDIKSVKEQYDALDAGSQCIAMAILQLAATLFMGIQQVQNVSEQQKKQG